MKRWMLMWSIFFLLQVHGQERMLQRASIPVIDGSYSNKQMLLSASPGNPSSLTKLQNFTAAAEMEATFLVKEARLFSALIVQPLDRNLIGLMMAHNGTSGYTQSAIGFFMNRELGMVQVGGELLIQHSTPAGYPATLHADGGISCRIEVSPVFNTGFRVRNISGFFSGEGYAPIIQAGVGYDVSGTVHAGCEWIQEGARPPLVTSGILYRFHRLFLVIAGINWSPCQPYGGFQLNHHHWKLLLKTSFHPVLGWSPSVGISFGKWKNEQE